MDNIENLVTHLSPPVYLTNYPKANHPLPRSQTEFQQQEHHAVTNEKEHEKHHAITSKDCKRTLLKSKTVRVTTPILVDLSGDESLV